MIKKILTYSVGEVLVKGISFLAVPLYSHLILPSEYGTLGFLNSLVSFLPFIFTFYYLYAFVRFSVEEEGETLLSTYFYMGLFLNIFYFLSAFTIYYFFVQRYQIALKYFSLSVLASSMIYLFQVLQMYYRSKGLARSYIKLSVFYSIVGLSLNFICLLLFKDNVLAMLVSSVITSLIVSVIAYVAIRKMIYWDKFDIKLVKKILYYSAPLVPGAIALLLFSQSDKIILLNYVTKDQLGVYTLAFTLGLSMSYIGSAFFMSYQPLFYEKVSYGYAEKIVDQFWKNIVFILSGLILSFLVIYFAYQFIDSRYLGGLRIALLIAVSYSMITFAQMMELHLTYTKKTAIVSLVYGVGGLVTVIFLMLLIPRLGIMGAAFSLLFGSVLISLLMFSAAQKFFYVPYNNMIVFLFYLIIFGFGWMLYGY
jgi:O-antigen/teichoic acid export membrane protein